MSGLKLFIRSSLATGKLFLLSAHKSTDIKTICACWQTKLEKTVKKINIWNFANFARNVLPSQIFWEIIIYWWIKKKYCLRQSKGDIWRAGLRESGNFPLDLVHAAKAHQDRLCKLWLVINAEESKVALCCPFKNQIIWLQPLNSLTNFGPSDPTCPWESNQVRLANIGALIETAPYMHESVGVNVDTLC